MSKPRLLRITTIPISLKILLRGQLRFFQEQGFEVLAVTAPGREVDDIRAAGIDLKTIPMTRTITPFSDLVSLLRLIRIIRKFRPDIVHTHTPKAGLLGMLAAWWCRVPVRMHTVAGLVWIEESGIRKWLLRFTERITYAFATGVYPNSAGLKTFIERNVHTKTPVRVIGRGSSNGININTFSRSTIIDMQATALRKEHDVSVDTIVFGFVGRVVRDKGINELVSAFESVSRKIKSKLILAGPFEDDRDPVSPETRKLLHEDKSIVVLGYVDDVRPLLRASDVFVFPSYREGFPNVVLQACAMECPCIVSDINGCNEIIEHDESGLVVPPRNVGELEAAMITLARDPEKRSAYATRARTFVVENFDQRHVWEELLGEYRVLLKRAR